MVEYRIENYLYDYHYYDFDLPIEAKDLAETVFNEADESGKIDDLVKFCAGKGYNILDKDGDVDAEQLAAYLDNSLVETELESVLPNLFDRICKDYESECEEKAINEHDKLYN